jgi:sugar phosphate isomerase/epimerase
MKIGVFTILFNDKPLDEVLEYLSGLGVQAAEIGTGGFSRSSHGNLDELLGPGPALQKFKDSFARHDMAISALSCHGNPVSPDREAAKRDHEDFERTVLLAEELGLDTVLVLSGCPGGSPEDKTPNWATCPWPPVFLKILEYQWNDVLIPYWKKCSEYALQHGVTKIGVEPHPGFCVYNTETLLKLRAAVGPSIGINLDPSHLFWQGIDPAKAIAVLGDAIFHVHAKDTWLNTRNIEINGVLDTKHYGRAAERSHLFRTVGYGHDAGVWKGIVSALAAAGYDGTLSVEHEDSLMAKEEGLEKAVSFLQGLVIRGKAGAMWWA